MAFLYNVQNLQKMIYNMMSIAPRVQIEMQRYMIHTIRGQVFMC